MNYNKILTWLTLEIPLGALVILGQQLGFGQILDTRRVHIANQFAANLLKVVLVRVQA